jgi:hypothetical protein
VIEMRDVRQDSQEYFRRWFFDDDFDLIAFFKPDGALAGFQLCYDKAGREKALMWFTGRGLSHNHVDSGEQSPWYNRSPMLAQVDGRAEMPRVLAEFWVAEEGLPAELKVLVVQKIEEYGQVR